MSSNPLVTVLLPVYNGELYLKDAIDSILVQSYSNFVFLIINDGSTDRSEEIILSYTDSRIKYISNEQNLGLISTLNKGLQLVNTKYVARMDADDISLPKRLEKQILYMEVHSNVGLLGTWCESFGDDVSVDVSKNNQECDHEKICIKQLYQIQMVHPTCMLRMDVIKSLKNVYDEDFLHAEDYELFTRLSHITKLANIPEVLHLYRKHDNAVSSLFNETQILSSLRIQQREFFRLGYTISQNQVKAYVSLNNQDYKKILLQPCEVREMLEQIYIANKKSRYCVEHLFAKYLQQLWIGYCYETRQSIRLYKSSALLRETLSVMRYVKWLLKHFFLL